MSRSVREWVDECKLSLLPWEQQIPRCARDDNSEQEGDIYGRGGLAEDVFDFVEDGGVAVCRFIVDLQGGVELLHQLALFARELAWSEYAHMVVQVATAAAMRIGKAFALDAEDRTALRALRNLQPLFASKAGHLEFRTERSLRDAQRNCAVEVRAAPLKEGVLLHFENDVEIAGRSAVGARFAFALYAKARASVDAGRNAEFDGALALQSGLVRGNRGSVP